MLIGLILLGSTDLRATNLPSFKHLDTTRDGTSIARFYVDYHGGDDESIQDYVRLEEINATHSFEIGKSARRHFGVSGFDVRIGFKYVYYSINSFTWTSRRHSSDR
ncbi:MAG: hypothetical protein ABSD30_11665 [Candidatus Binatus sp.]|jgi:hypothetical protein